MKEGIYVARQSEALERRFKEVAKDSPQVAFRMLKWAVTRAHELTIEKLRGPVLKKRTGILMGSYHAKAAASGTRINAMLFSTCIYAPVQEFGATIRAKNAPYLHFKGNKGWARVKEVTIPPRPHALPSVEQALGEALDKDWYKF